MNMLRAVVVAALLAVSSAYADGPCTVPAKKYSGEGFGYSGASTGGYGLTVERVEGEQVTAVFHNYRTTRNCGGSYPAAGTCTGNQLRLKVQMKSDILGCSQNVVTLHLDYQEDGGLVGKLGMNIIRDTGAPPNIRLR